jgi:hypothetical protein
VDRDSRTTTMTVVVDAINRAELLQLIDHHLLPDRGGGYKAVMHFDKPSG